MSTTVKKDLQPYKNKLMELSYNEKIEMSEWLHTQIDLERGEAVKEKMKQVGEQTDNFLKKAAEVTKTAGNSLMNSFKKATSNEANSDSNSPEKR
jgi:hypothetical protein